MKQKIFYVLVAMLCCKTAGNGTDRYIWGWCPFREGADIWAKNINVGGGDGNEPAWSGALVCHKLIQHENGTLSVGVVPAMAAKYNKPAEVKVMSQGNGNTLYNRLGTHNHITFTVKAAPADRWGVSFVHSDEIDGGKCYTFICNPEWENGRRKINFEEDNGVWFIDGGDGYIMPRPEDNVYNVDIFTDNSVVTMYINGIYGYTQRVYGLQGNCWSINTYGGDVQVSDVKVSQY